jgi:hypothetical protein
MWTPNNKGIKMDIIVEKALQLPLADFEGQGLKILDQFNFEDQDDDIRVLRTSHLLAISLSKLLVIRRINQICASVVCSKNYQY